MYKRIALAVFAVIVIFLFGLLIGAFFQKFFGARPPAQIYNTSTVIKQIQGLSELVTVKYVMEKIVILEVPPESVLAQLFSGQSRLMLLAHGITKAGIDFQQVGTNDLSIVGKKVSIKIPQAKITDSYLDDSKTQVLERTTGLFRPFDKDLEQNARRQAVDDLKRSARSNGILKEADERARTQLTNLFHQLGFSEVEFR